MELLKKSYFKLFQNALKLRNNFGQVAEIYQNYAFRNDDGKNIKLRGNVRAPSNDMKCLKIEIT